MSLKLPQLVARSLLVLLDNEWRIKITIYPPWLLSKLFTAWGNTPILKMLKFYPKVCIMLIFIILFTGPKDYVTAIHIMLLNVS